ncbi:MAG: helix-turn-helix transcriptional regulator [Bacteroidetes bacterium]|nr:helix-turn-helix transcriptional regulator [Bacteroidota bacterium]
MINFNEYIAANPAHFRQLTCGETLFTVYNCGLAEKFVQLWSHNNYIVYVASGRKIWHTAEGSFELKAGDCKFIKRGAAIVEQFFEKEFCFYLFFVPDTFICDVLKTKSTPIEKGERNFTPVINIESSDTVHAFFTSMLPYYNAPTPPDQALLQLKFSELILTIADNTANRELLCYFCTLLHMPQAISLQHIMEENYCYNLKLEDYARLSYRSLSAFKRDFEQLYHTTPGKWLMEKKLNRARQLITVAGKTVSDAAFESGFESIAHFSRAFSRQFGMPPSATRKMLSLN